MTYGAKIALEGQTGFWGKLAACLPETTQRQLVLEDSEGVTQEWLEPSVSHWRYLAESTALQIVALEAFRFPRPTSSRS